MLLSLHINITTSMCKMLPLYADINVATTVVVMLLSLCANAVAVNVAITV